MNVFGLLSQAARRWPDGVAVCDGERVVRTWSALEHAALAIAARLRAELGPASRVAIVSENRPAWIETVFGIWAAGMVAVPINYKLRGRNGTFVAATADDATRLAQQAAWAFAERVRALRLTTDEAIAYVTAALRSEPTPS